MARIALIGLGMVSDTYVDAIRNAPDLELAVIHARSGASRDAFTGKHPDMAVRAVATVEGLIAARPDYDFAIVATPPDGRDDLVAALVAAKTPILMEKPVERTLAAATDLVNRCADAGVPLGIMLQHRARGAVADLRALWPSLGQLFAVEVAVPWWRPQSYYDAPGRGSYARDGGGVMISQAIHTMDLMLHLTGPVTDVVAMAATTGFHDMEAEDFVSAGLRFESGAVGTLFASTASFPGRGERLIFHAEHGSARLEAGLIQVDWQDGRSETIGTAATSGAGADPMAFTSDWHRAVIEDFAAAIDAGRDPMVTGASALPVHQLIDALERSAKTGTRQEVRG